MDYNYSKKNLRIISLGLIVNAIAVVMLTGIDLSNAIAGTNTYANVGLILIVRLIVLGLNIYAFNFMRSVATKQSVTLAMLMAIAGILSLNLFGSLIVIFGYLNIRKHDLIEEGQGE